MNKRALGRYLLLPGILLLLAACAQQPVQSPIAPVQSPNDDREYRYLVLDNGLKALLIADDDAEKATASLDIYVGSAQNPEDRAGLAHFLEHMLFLGTEKYPDPAEYEQFVTEHGGSRNAYTGFEHTNYFFDIDQEYLAPALDRFAQFFISPKFDAEYVGREVNAVEAEYQMGIKTDGRRTLDVLREVANPDHPFSILGVGTAETLGSQEGRQVRDDLLRFYEQYYSANLMSLVVLGRGSLDELETMVREMFSAVPNRGVEVADIAAPLYSEGTLPALVTVEPEASERQLQLSFPLPDYREHYQRQSVSYIGNLLGHEGEGSLLSVLKQAGWAEALGAGAGLAWRGGSAFSLTITLTEKGLAEHEAVLAKVFEYIEMVRRHGPDERLYQEQSLLAAQQFRFRETVEPMRYVAALSNDMHYYQPDDVLRGRFIMSDYDAAEISALLNDYLVPDNALAILIAKGVATNRQSEFYFTPYAVNPVQNSAVWLAGQSGDLDERLHVPAPNAFIAEDLEIKPREARTAELPQQLVDTPSLKLWYQQDNEYLVPRGAMYLSFRNANAGASARQIALGEMYVSLLRDSVNEMTYPAALAGLNFSFYRHTRGVSLKISGYNAKQMVLLNSIVDAIRDGSFSEDRFANMRADLIRNLENFKTARPFRQTIRRSSQLLNHGEWDEQVMIAELGRISLADIKEHAEDFWGDVQADVLLNGNYQRDIIYGVQSALAPLLVNESPTPVAQLKIAQLQPGQNFVYPIEVGHDDSVLFHYIQAPANDWPSRAVAALTGQALKSGFFQQLRTEQQLGYVVSAFYWPQLDVPGLGFIIQSPGSSAVDVAAAVDTFLAASLADGGISEEQFLRHRKALVGEILQPYKNLWEQSEYYWQEIGRRHLDFDSRKALAEAVQATDYEQWRAAARAMVLEQPAQVRVVAEGRWQQHPEGELIADPLSFQATQPAYEID